MAKWDLDPYANSDPGRAKQSCTASKQKAAPAGTRKFLVEHHLEHGGNSCSIPDCGTWYNTFGPRAIFLTGTWVFTRAFRQVWVGSSLPKPVERKPITSLDICKSTWLSICITKCQGIAHSSFLSILTIAHCNRSKAEYILREADRTSSSMA